MKKILLFLFITSILFSCKEENLEDANCEPTFCTLNFVYVPIKFTDKNGAGINVTNFEVLNKRTLKKITVNNTNPTNQTGTYIVIDDSAIAQVSKEGDDLVVSAKNPVNNVTKQVILNVKGGKCSCHVEKVSGPTEVIVE